MSVIKLTIDPISKTLTNIINWFNGVVPFKIRIAKIISLYKADDKTVIKNYKPVSILPAFP